MGKPKPNKYCKCCGRESNELRKYKGEFYCNRHYQQMAEHGFCLDNSPRDEEDENELYIDDKNVHMFLYDNITQEELDDSAILDLDDYDKVKGIRFDLKRKCVTTKINDNIIMLQNYLLDTKDRVEFINGNYLDFRKENLRIIKKETKVKKVDKRRKGKIDIVGYGASVIQVTASSWGIHYDNTKENRRECLLIEAGLSQGKTVAEDYAMNKSMIDMIPFEECSAMLFSHCHLDHLMNAVASVRKGFNGIVYMTKVQKVIAEQLLLDGCYIHERNVKELNKHGRNATLLYTESDVYLFLNRIKLVEMNEKIKINDNVEFMLRNNSHVLGASQIELWIRKPSNQVKHILYTGDLGSNYNFEFQPFLTKNEIIRKCDLAIFESTYASSSRSFTKKDCIEERNEIKKIFLDTIKNKSRCLIPTFSYSRGQLFMCMAYDWLKDCKDNFQVVIDSRLYQNINQAYREVLEGEDKEYWDEVMRWDRFKFVGQYKETLELSTKQDGIPRIIFSSSGFADAGHVRTWLPSILNNPKDTLIFAGYASPNSLAGKIREQKDDLFVIDGIRCMRNCNIKIFRTFSSHIQQDELINYFKQMSVGKIILHHGELNAKQELKEKATKELRAIGKTTKIICTDKGVNEFTL